MNIKKRHTKWPRQYQLHCLGRFRRLTSPSHFSSSSLSLSSSPVVDLIVMAQAAWLVVAAFRGLVVVVVRRLVVVVVRRLLWLSTLVVPVTNKQQT
jgi:hypothetical protein